MADGVSSAGPSPMGLREFSKAVWNKVMEKGETDYHEVAEEMLADIRGHLGGEAAFFDERNVRRRVYDALNVLMAVGVIEKDKAARKIIWRGMPCGSARESELLERLLKVRERKVDAKRRVMNELTRQVAAMRVLIQRNQLRCQKTDNTQHVHLPFFTAGFAGDATLFASFASSKELMLSTDKACSVTAHPEVLNLLGLDDLPGSDLQVSLPSELPATTEDTGAIF